MVVPWIIFSTLLKNGHDIAFFSSHQEIHLTAMTSKMSLRASWCVSQFPQNSRMYLIRTHKLMDVQVSQTVTSLIYAYRGRGIAPPVPTFWTIHWKAVWRAVVSEDWGKKLLSTSAFSLSVFIILPMIYVDIFWLMYLWKPLFFFFAPLAKSSSSWALSLHSILIHIPSSIPIIFPGYLPPLSLPVHFLLALHLHSKSRSSLASLLPSFPLAFPSGGALYHLAQENQSFYSLYLERSFRVKGIIYLINISSDLFSKSLISIAFYIIWSYFFSSELKIFLWLLIEYKSLVAMAKLIANALHKQMYFIDLL